MFSSPSVRLFTSENVDNLVQRKPGNNLLSRKPFVDRSVNSKTPDIGKLRKPKLNLIEEPAKVDKPVSPKCKDDLNAEDFMYSYKGVKDTYEDIWPKPERLSTEGLVKILRNYCKADDTPPPSMPSSPVKIDPMFFELPVVEAPTLPIDEEFFNQTFDVDLPSFNYDLDTSI